MAQSYYENILMHLRTMLMNQVFKLLIIILRVFIVKLIQNEDNAQIHCRRFTSQTVT